MSILLNCPCVERTCPRIKMQPSIFNVIVFQIFASRQTYPAPASRSLGQPDEGQEIQSKVLFTIKT